MEKKAQALWMVSMNFTGTPEQEVEFNEWYNKEHVRDVLTMPGFLAANRYVAVRQAKTQPKYTTVYEIENADIMMEQLQGPLNARISEIFRERYLKLTSDWTVWRWKRIGP